MMTPWDKPIPALPGFGGRGDGTLRFKNGSGGEIPAYGLMIPSSWDSTQRCIVLDVVDGENQPVVFVNTGGPVADGKYGQCICASGPVFFAKYDTAGAALDPYGWDDETTMVLDNHGAYLVADTGTGSVGMFCAPPIVFGEENTSSPAWTRGDDLEEGVSFTIVTNVSWSSPNLTQTKVTVKFDSFGMLYDVSAPANSTIDTAEDCTA